MKRWILLSIPVLLAAGLWHLAPKYPDGHENVTLKRMVFGALFHGAFKLSIVAERLGLVADSAVLIQGFFPKHSSVSSVDNCNIGQSVIAGVPVIIFRPTSLKAAKNRAIVYFHGGGFVLGSSLSHYKWTLRLATNTSSVVISVDYRLAPQHPFPAGLEDCISVTKGVFDSAETLGIDRNRIAVAGDSAGGNLAAVVALELALSEQYKLRAQLLFSPVLVAAGVSMLPSYAHYSTLFMIHLDWFIVKYAGQAYTRDVENAINLEHHVSNDDINRLKHLLNVLSLPDDLLSLIPDRKFANVRIGGANEEELARRPKKLVEIGKLALSKRAWPLMEDDNSKLQKVAPVLIELCGFDPLRDEGLFYVNRLRSLGVSVSLSFLPNAIHAEPLIRDILGSPPSKATLKGVADAIKFVEEHL